MADDHPAAVSKARAKTGSTALSKAVWRADRAEAELARTKAALEIMGNGFFDYYNHHHALGPSRPEAELPY